LLLNQCLGETSKRFPDKTYLLFASKAIGFREIDGLSDRLTCALRKLAAWRGDRVSAMLDSSVEMASHDGPPSRRAPWSRLAVTVGGRFGVAASIRIAEPTWVMACAKKPVHLA
jgi:hypothetical protein